MEWQQFSVYLIGFGFTLNGIGAVLNSLHQKIAFLIWMTSNLICAIYFGGAWKGKWKVKEFAAAMFLLMYIFFFGTATWGYFN